MHLNFSISVSSRDMHGVQEYYIDGQFAVGPCNIVDKWNGQFKYWKLVYLPCGCLIYTGDLRIAQDNHWPDIIDEGDDFPFKLICNACNDEIAYCESAQKVQSTTGWAYLFP